MKCLVIINVHTIPFFYLMQSGTAIPPPPRVKFDEWFEGDSGAWRAARYKN